MGLYQKIIALSEKPKGLLKKAEQVLETVTGIEEEQTTSVPVSFFEQFARDYGYSRACLLLPEDNLYKAAYVYGMSQKSLEQGFSTRDFWDGTLTDTKEWATINGENLVPYLQLFSEKDRDDIQQILIRRVSYSQYNLDYIILLPQEAEYSFYTPEELNRSLIRLNEYLMV